MISAEQLGNALFRQRYGLRYAYVAGSMYKGISSKELVVRLAKAQLLGFFGTGGLKLAVIRDSIAAIQGQLLPDQPYGMNLLCQSEYPEAEMAQVMLFLEKGIRSIEAAAFTHITPALVCYRLKQISQNADGTIHVPHKIIAKVSHEAVAKAFMSPPPANMVQSLVVAGKLTEQEARLGERIPMAHEICVEADSGGHTDQGVLTVLVPTIKRLSQTLMDIYRYHDVILIGAAGGIGTPEAAAAAFLLGADFIVTGSINQCTQEAGTSRAVKDMLQQADIQDTTYVPAGDMFELGAKVQVYKKGLLFPARANKLYELYKQYPSLEALDEKTQHQIQEKYFQRSFHQVWEETKKYYSNSHPHQLEKAERNPKHKMALLFKWYFIHTTRLALQGSQEQCLDYQIHCGPALGAFNSWVKGTALEDWRHRHVDHLAAKLLTEAATYLSRYLEEVSSENEIDSAKGVWI